MDIFPKSCHFFWNFGGCFWALFALSHLPQLVFLVNHVCHTREKLFLDTSPHLRYLKTTPKLRWFPGFQPLFLFLYYFSMLQNQAKTFTNFYFVLVLNIETSFPFFLFPFIIQRGNAIPGQRHLGTLINSMLTQWAGEIKPTQPMKWSLDSKDYGNFQNIWAQTNYHFYNKSIALILPREKLACIWADACCALCHRYPCRWWHKLESRLALPCAGLEL